MTWQIWTVCVATTTLDNSTVFTRIPAEPYVLPAIAFILIFALSALLWSLCFLRRRPISTCLGSKPLSYFLLLVLEAKSMATWVTRIHIYFGSSSLRCTGRCCCYESILSV
ncbi:hypothetical protein ARMGADRAFT_90405 [Armillaria gallica]|uniref:Uncharacterized protein n=1 Tax=Armillaria gallica TaxID=47427 RepID=A0A2H3DGI3_ARMGA|nr:hypothetical protein ARMGADRAFT_90405 [Armillaria gallica]